MARSASCCAAAPPTSSRLQVKFSTLGLILECFGWQPARFRHSIAQFQDPAWTLICTSTGWHAGGAFERRQRSDRLSSPPTAPRNGKQTRQDFVHFRPEGEPEPTDTRKQRTSLAESLRAGLRSPGSGILRPPASAPSQPLPKASRPSTWGVDFKRILKH